MPQGLPLRSAAHAVGNAEQISYDDSFRCDATRFLRCILCSNASINKVGYGRYVPISKLNHCEHHCAAGFLDKTRNAIHLHVKDYPEKIQSDLDPEDACNSFRAVQRTVSDV